MLCADVLVVWLTRNVKLFQCQLLACSPFVQKIFAKHLMYVRQGARHWKLNHKQSRRNTPFSWSYILYWGHPEVKIGKLIVSRKGQVVVSIVRKI